MYKISALWLNGKQIGEKRLQMRMSFMVLCTKTMRHPPVYPNLFAKEVRREQRVDVLVTMSTKK